MWHNHIGKGLPTVPFMLTFWDAMTLELQDTMKACQSWSWQKWSIAVDILCQRRNSCLLARIFRILPVRFCCLSYESARPEMIESTRWLIWHSTSCHNFGLWTWSWLTAGHDQITYIHMYVHRRNGPEGICIHLAGSCDQKNTSGE